MPTSVSSIASYGVLGIALIAGPARADVLTQRYDNGRTGRTVDASITPSSFDRGNWQKVGELPVSGAVYAQPLFVSAQRLGDGSTHDAVIVATANNLVYAFDAEPPYRSLWAPANLGAPDTVDQKADPKYACAQMSPRELSGPTAPPAYGIGIQSTPVIDRTLGPNGTLFVSYRTNTGTSSATAKQWIAQIDLGTGSAVTSHEITAPELGQSAKDGNGQGVAALRQRASLLLANGVLYVAFGSHCENFAVPGMHDYNDLFSYRGVILAFEPGALRYLAHFETVLPGVELPQTHQRILGGGIWQASSGIAADEDGTVYFTTGNAVIDQTNLQDESSNTSASHVPNSIVHLTPTVQRQAGRVASLVFPASGVDWFTPYRSEWLNRADLDLGSAGVLLPRGGSEVIGGGKEGILYVLNRSNLGHYSAQHWTPKRVSQQGDLANAQCITKAEPDAISQIANLCDPHCYEEDGSGGDAVIQKFRAAANIDCDTPNMGNWIGWPHIHGTPVYGRAGDGKDYLYLWPEKDQLKAWRRPVPGGLFDAAPIVATATAPNRGMPGGVLSLSAAPNDSSTVVFAAVPLENTLIVDSQHPERSSTSINAGALLAFDGTPAPGPSGLGQGLRLLWADDNADVTPYVHAKFVPPTVAGGRVFLATFSNRVNIYGPSPTPVVSGATQLAGALLSGARATAFAVDQAGSIAVFGHSNASPGDWPSTRLATLGAAGTFPAGAAVATGTLGTRAAVFAVAADASLQMFRQSADANVWSGPTNLSRAALTPGSNAALVLAPGAALATQQRGAELDVFTIAADGDIWVFKTTDATNWVLQKVSSVSPKFQPGAPLVSDMQGSAQLDVLAVDTQGNVWVHWSGATPQGAWLGAKINNVRLLPGAHLATGHRPGSDLDVYAIGGSALYARPSVTCGPNDANGDTGCLKVLAVNAFGWSSATIPRATPLAFGPGVPGSPVAAVRQGSNQIDVFFVSQTGAVMVYFAADGGGWVNAPLNGPATLPAANGEVQRILPSALLRAQPGAPIVALPSALAADGSPTSIDVLVPSRRLQSQGLSGIFGASTSLGAATWTNPFRAL